MGAIGGPELIVALLQLAFLGAIGAALGERRGRTVVGFLLSGPPAAIAALYFGRAAVIASVVAAALGWMTVRLLPNNLPKCRQCKGDVIAGAKRCKKCGSKLPAAA